MQLITKDNGIKRHIFVIWQTYHNFKEQQDNFVLLLEYIACSYRNKSTLFFNDKKYLLFGDSFVSDQITTYRNISFCDHRYIDYDIYKQFSLTDLLS